MNLRVVQMARRSCGPRALWNRQDGTPDLESTASVRGPGQLVYYVQAVDWLRHPVGRDAYLQALRFVNLSRSAGMHGVLGCYVGASARHQEGAWP